MWQAAEDQMCHGYVGIINWYGLTVWEIGSNPFKIMRWSPHNSTQLAAR